MYSKQLSNEGLEATALQFGHTSPIVSGAFNLIINPTTHRNLRFPHLTRMSLPGSSHTVFVEYIRMVAQLHPSWIQLCQDEGVWRVEWTIEPPRDLVVCSIRDDHLGIKAFELHMQHRKHGLLSAHIVKDNYEACFYPCHIPPEEPWWNARGHSLSSEDALSRRISWIAAVAVMSTSHSDIWQAINGK